MTARSATVQRRTRETDIRLTLVLDGAGDYDIDTGIGFFDHMLALFARHGLFDLVLQAEGDLNVDRHHTVEDVGLCLGEALRQALGEKVGIRRYGFFLLPMQEALVEVALDLSGRAHLSFVGEIPRERAGDFETELVEEFLTAFANAAGLALHVEVRRGRNAHHVIEAIFKGLARALDQATSIDPRTERVPSTKGML